MRITLLATGSRGDTQPYLALALALQALGHQPRVAAFENFCPWIERYGIEAFPVRGDVTAVAASELAQRAMQADNPLKVALSFNELKHLTFGIQKDFFAACAGAEVVAYHPGALIGHYAAHHWGIPGVLALPFPMTPTTAYPSLLFYDSVRLGGWFNMATHHLLEQIFWRTSYDPVAHFWREAFGRVPPRLPLPFASQPTLVSCSAHIFARPADWPQRVHMGGYWFLPAEPGWQPPAALEAFLRAGSPPVYVGFGSMGNPQQAGALTALVVQALRQAGVRGVLATGWHGLAQPTTPASDMLVLESAPHSWLFPRMAAVVHHGGAGTTAAAWQAGVPQVVVPHGNDQFAWGRRVAELGAGVAVPRRQLTAARLAAALSRVLNPAVQATAQTLGSKISAEHGAHAAAHHLLQQVI